MMESVLMVMSKAGNARRAPRNAIGTPAATHIASRKRRKSARIPSTRSSPVRAFPSSALIRACRDSASSIQIVSEIPSGRRVFAVAT